MQQVTVMAASGIGTRRHPTALLDIDGSFTIEL
jgi:hypothetical protein